MINFEISDRQTKIEAGDLENLVEKAVNTVAYKFGIDKDIEISVVFTDNSEIQKINNEFRNIDNATDVLSFPQFEFTTPGIIDNAYFEEPYPMLGDIVISLERAKEQSQEYGHSFEREVSYLVVHSMLHLLGYDHMLSNDKKLMREQEKIIMDKLGLPDDGE